MDKLGFTVFENSLKYTRISLLCSGIRTTETKWNSYLTRLFDRYWYYFNLLWLYMDVGGEVWWSIDGILTGKGFLELSLAAPCITISFLATVKSIFLYLNRDIVKQVIDKLKEIHPEVDDKYVFNSDDAVELSAKESFEKVKFDMLNEAMKMLKFVVYLLYYICGVVMVAFPILPVFSMIYDYRTKGEFEYEYPYLVKYFFDPFKMSLWPFIYIHHVWSTVIVGVYVTGSDTLFYAVCIYIHMHFRILGHRFENIVTGDTASTRNALCHAVRRHQELIFLVDQVELLYTKSILFNIITSSVLICLSGFIITMVKDIGVVITFATFLFMSLSQISMLCYFGDLLMRSSTQISTAIYSSLWYETDERIKKSMLLILIRAQKPCKLTAYKFADLNLSAFTTILSRSWSYFALLKTIYK